MVKVEYLVPFKNESKFGQNSEGVNYHAVEACCLVLKAEGTAKKVTIREHKEGNLKRQIDVFYAKEIDKSTIGAINDMLYDIYKVELLASKK